MEYEYIPKIIEKMSNSLVHLFVIFAISGYSRSQDELLFPNYIVKEMPLSRVFPFRGKDKGSA